MLMKHINSALEKPLLRSFGRRQGRKLNEEKQVLFEQLSPHYLITPTLHLPLDLPALYHTPSPSLYLEIGFGGGEHLLGQAIANPNICFIGSEPFRNGVVSLLEMLAPSPLKNLKIWHEDIRQLLPYLKAHSLQKVFILFPDPWPKRKHHKRRLIQREFLTLLAEKMAPGAELRLATDHQEYAKWILNQLIHHPDFYWMAEKKSDWESPPEDWISTRYQQKALKEGRKTIYLRFKRQ